MRIPRAIIVVIVLLAIGTAINSVLVWAVLSKISSQADVNTASTHALCVLRDDLKTRVKSSTDFLAMHPDGIPGIPAKTLRDGIHNQQRTISALRTLQCSTR